MTHFLGQGENGCVIRSEKFAYKYGFEEAIQKEYDNIARNADTDKVQVEDV